MVGDFTTAVGEALGCDVSMAKAEKGVPHAVQEVKPPINRVLPRVMIDGPFGSASEDFYKFEACGVAGE
jgi:NADPH oxidase